MKRKITILALSAMLLALCSSADAQQPKKVPRIGYLSAQRPATDSARSDAIRLALRERGHIEGQNIAIEYRYAEGKLDRLPELAAELVRLKVDLIVVAAAETAIRAAKNATKTIPIVMLGQGADPVEAGLIESLARPGGNVTGLTNLARKLATFRCKNQFSNFGDCRTFCEDRRSAERAASLRLSWCYASVFSHLAFCCGSSLALPGQ